MGLFNFLKKKPKQAEADLPPPPQPNVKGPDELVLPPELPKTPQRQPMQQRPSAPRPSLQLPKEPTGVNKERQLQAPQPPKRTMPKPAMEKPTVPKREWKKRPIPSFKKRVESMRAKPMPPKAPVHASRPQEKKVMPATHHGKEKEEKPFPRVHTMHAREGPLFVGVQDFQSILNKVNHMRKTLNDSEKLISKMNEIKSEEESLLESWRKRVEDIERKLNYVDSIIFKGE